MRKYWADQIGYWAYQSLQMFSSGLVVGITSRGLFLLLGGEQVVFLSNESHLSPLTVTLQPGGGDWKDVNLRDSVAVYENKFRIAGAVEISIAEARVWQPSLLQLQAINPPEGVPERLSAVAHRLLELKGEVGWGGFLAHLLDCREQPPGEEILVIEQHINALRVAMFSERVERVRMALKPFFGLGRGLTPSGDDFIIGMILVLSRWPRSVNFHPNLGELLDGIVSDAQLQTTRISQAMITCAAHGYADERLLDAIDGIITGGKSMDECAELLASYGGSSGVDALVGIASLFLF